MSAQPLRALEDGMTADAIESIVDEMHTEITKERKLELEARDRALDEKLEKHKRDISAIVTPAVSKIDGMAEDVCLLVGNSKTTGLVQQVIDGQTKAAAQGKVWRRSDVRFRRQTLQELGGNRRLIEEVNVKVDSNHAEVVDKLDSINWLVKTSQGLRKVGDGVLFIGKRGKGVWLMVATLMTGWVAVFQYIHNVMPKTEHWIEIHHRMVMWAGIALLVLAVLVGLTKAPDEEQPEPNKEGEAKNGTEVAIVRENENRDSGSKG